MPSSYFYRLALVHRRLDDEISREFARASGDGLRIVRLKKLKLALKDRLSRLTPQSGRGA